MSFDGKVILIVGFNSRVGAVAAQYFSKEKAKLALVSLNEDRFHSVLESIKEIGVKTEPPLFITGDVTKDSKRIIDETVKKYGRLDILFNNAGFTIPASIETLKIEDFDAMMRRNVRGLIELTANALPYLISSRGNVINNACFSNLIPIENFLFYCITKAALDQFTKCAALELKNKNVRINSISPGCIDTEFHHYIGIDRDKEEEEYVNFLELNNIKGPIRCNGSIDCINAIAFLAKENPKFEITGVVIPVDSDISTRSL